MYGWNPGLKKFFHFKGIGRSKHASGPDYAAMGYGMGGPGYMPGGQGMGGPMMQGTLVFPNHSFVRSPRDYFMVDVNK